MYFVIFICLQSSNYLIKLYLNYLSLLFYYIQLNYIVIIIENKMIIILF